VGARFVLNKEPIMKHPDRNLVRLANEIRGHLLTFCEGQTLRWVESLRGLIERMEQMQGLYRKLDRCRCRNLPAAAGYLRQRSIRVLPEMLWEIQQLQRILARPEASAPPLADLVAEIRQIEQEFGSYQYDRSKGILSVTTEPIELANIDLGPFQVNLHLANLACLGHRGLYDVQAIEPHPAAGDSGVTHPHVSHGQLCEGDDARVLRQRFGGEVAAGHAAQAGQEMV
jgi:hypothetical protein